MEVEVWLTEIREYRLKILSHCKYARFYWLFQSFYWLEQNKWFNQCITQHLHCLRMALLRTCFISEPLVVNYLTLLQGSSYFAPLWKKVWLKSLFDCVPFVCYYDPVGVPRAWMCACSEVLLEQAKLLATNGHDELGIKATQHPTGKSNSSALHHPTQPHSLFCPMHSHYSPFHPSLLTFLTLHPFRSPTPPLFSPSPPPHIFTSPLSSTLLTVFSPSMWMVTHISIFGLATSSLQSSFLPQRQEIFIRYCAPYLPGT